MKCKRFLLFIAQILFSFSLFAQQTIWNENFDIPDKGYWGDVTGIPVGDMSGISKWTIDVSACALTISTRYIKTVSTSGGRLQAVAINGEAIWVSEIIDISSRQNTSVSVSVSETGTSTSIAKYVKLYYRLDGGSETLFESNGENIGNFGSLIASQSHLNGNNLQLIVRFNNPNTGDACIIDNVLVQFDNVKPGVSDIVSINSNTMRVIFSEPVDKITAETIDHYNVEVFGMPASAKLDAGNASINLVFLSKFIDLQKYRLQISGVTDLNENTINDTVADFIFRQFKLESVIAVSENQLLLNFTHPVDPVFAANSSNYLVNNNIGNPSLATLLSDTVVNLLFTSNFNNNGNYALAINNLKNIYNVALTDTTINFIWHQPQEFDLIINELMVDVNPAPNVLPPSKYIELQNRSLYDIYLKGWTLQIGENTPVKLPEKIFKSKSNLIICPSTQVSNFNLYGQAVGILSESQLTISSRPVYLFDNDNNPIDYVKYSDSWYGDDKKSAGGWSLERIDADNFCGEAQNWAASIDFKGGTPGKTNSVSNSNPDNSKPKLRGIKVLSSYKMLLTFSKNLSSESALNPTNYKLDNESNIPAMVIFPDTSRSSVMLQFTGQFIDSQEQTLSVVNLKDFCGNSIDPVSEKFIYYLLHLKSAFAESDNILHLIFSDEVDISSAQNTVNYKVNDGMGSPDKAIKHSSKKNEVYLEFSGNFENGKDYTIHIESIKDLDGNICKPVDLSFNHYVPKPNDLVINEILFNPKSSGVDFVEIYNKSGFPVDLSKMRIASRDDQGNLESVNPLADKNMLYESNHFMAISVDSLKLKNEYPAITYDKFLQISSMPSFNDDKGIVVLLYDDLIIDEFAYNEGMHFGLISNTEGVSLERIDPDNETQLASNWHSASQNCGFASPANQNSQFRKTAETINDELVVEPQSFSPNNDGFDDQIFIRYKFDEPGYVANVNIYDGKGRLIKRVVSNELLATEGEFSWDGLNESGVKANIGIYVVYFEVFNLSGVVKHFKKVCVVADKLN